ncbi:MAG: amidohydrolase [Armatimonadetes bacterium]|nr:amidohydrolase [Armatimonadota bacterium]
MSAKAELILTNGRIFTLWDERPWASAVDVGNGRILAVGDYSDAGEFRTSETEIVDLGGRTVIPGLTDSHNHLLYYGQTALHWADLTGCRSMDELLNRLRAHDAATCSDWILGIRFDHEILAERRMPTREDLDKVSTEKPVFIVRLCGHAVVANSKAVELAGPERLPESGRRTGILTEDDQGPIWEKIPDPSFEQLVEAARFAAGKARSTGITSVHALIGSMDELNALRRLHESGDLPVRIYVQPGYGMMDKLIEEGLRTGTGDDMLRIGSAKIFADGSMGARTAAMVDDFTDDPGNKGLLLHTDEEMTEMVRKVHRSGWQAAIHAIGDRAVEQAVDAIETVLAETGEDNRVRRHRVEHASILSEKLVEKMARLHILAAVQPQFVITDFWTVDRVGPERYRWTYPFRTLMQAGVPISFGSDSPVELLDAFELIHRAVTRDEHSRQECISVEQAIRIYALGGPYFAFQETEHGSLQPGKFADMVVLDRDVFTIPPSEIPLCKAEATFVGGAANPTSSA